MIYLGLCLDSMNILPMYSPRIPRKAKESPNKKNITTIIEVQPGATAPYILRKTNTMPSRRLERHRVNPEYVANRIGVREKESMFVVASETFCL